MEPSQRTPKDKTSNPWEPMPWKYPTSFVPNVFNPRTYLTAVNSNVSGLMGQIYSLLNPKLLEQEWPKPLKLSIILILFSWFSNIKFRSLFSQVRGILILTRPTTYCPSGTSRTRASSFWVIPISFTNRFTMLSLEAPLLVVLLLFLGFGSVLFPLFFLTGV